jgi:cation transporter-like permease
MKKSHTDIAKRVSAFMIALIASPLYIAISFYGIVEAFSRNMPVAGNGFGEVLATFFLASGMVALLCLLHVMAVAIVCKRTGERNVYIIISLLGLTVVPGLFF